MVGCRLPDLDWIRPAVFDGAYASLVVGASHRPRPILLGAGRTPCKAGGPLVLVVNHPLFTAPGSGPIVDPTDGEVFWRWGTYLEVGARRRNRGFMTGDVLSPTNRANFSMPRPRRLVTGAGKAR